MSTLIIIGVLGVLGLGALYSLLVLAHPVAACWSCRGRKVRKTGRGKARKCHACKGMGHVVRPGAGAVHRFWWSVWGDKRRDLRRIEVADGLREKGWPGT